MYKIVFKVNPVTQKSEKTMALIESEAEYRNLRNSAENLSVLKETRLAHEAYRLALFEGVGELEVKRLKDEYDKKKSRRIRYVHSAEHPERAGLFEVAGIDVTDRDKKARAVDFCTSCLQGWVDMGWISGFAEVRDKGRGRPVGGVDITL